MDNRRLTPMRSTSLMRAMPRTSNPIPGKMPGLDVAGGHADVETAVAPLVPDGGEEHAAVRPVRGKHGAIWSLQQITELVDGSACHVWIVAPAGRLTSWPGSGPVTPRQRPGCAALPGARSRPPPRRRA